VTRKKVGQSADSLRQWNGPAVLLSHPRSKLPRGAKDKEHAMSHTLNAATAIIGIVLEEKPIGPGLDI
jgi:hypothetical protein